MISLHTTSVALVTAIVLTVAGPADSMTTSGGSLRLTGTGRGMWTTPEYHDGSGMLFGSALLKGSQPALYTFEATLTDAMSTGPIVCLGCLDGDIVGTLDDGIGVGPDYYVFGSYFGVFSSGDGMFRGVIRDTPFPVSPPVGTFDGRFMENPGSGRLGVFNVTFQIRP